MNKFLRILLIAVCVLVVAAAVGITFTIGWRPFIGPRSRAVTGRHFEATPARLARGEYLVRGVLLCFDCHSEHDWKAPGMPPTPGMEGAGEVFPEEDLPGRVVAQNITPDRETGVGTWTDDELARAIREGVDRKGRALFPMMPYTQFRRMSDDDLAAVIVFIRSLPAVRHKLPETKVVFPVNLLIRTVPEPVTSPVPPPDLSTPERRGEYLVNLASCGDCHTPAAQGRQDETKRYAGGQVFKGPWGSVTSANITPDKTGIAYYNEKIFVEAMRTGSVMGRPIHPLMPWQNYRDMTDEDLKAVFAFLRTIKPVQNRIARPDTSQ
jgi:mono/diheme cytochrome c family protein